MDTKEQALKKAVAEINKRFGEGTIMALRSAAAMQTQAISTGSLVLDNALGIGGVPRGRITEIYGPESSGKTTVCLHVIKAAQEAGGFCAIIDAEHALDPQYAEKIGVKTQDLLISQPDNGEQALEICETLVRSGVFDVIVIDSVAALVPQKELEGDMGDAQMGVMGRMMSQALRKLAGVISKTNTTVIFTNQLRQKIGVLYGNPETTTGGMALKFYASVRMDIRRSQQIKKGDEVLGNHVTVKVVKNKVAPPYRVAQFDIIFNEGISKLGEIVDLGVTFEVITKRGAFYSYGDQRIGQGRDAAINFLRGNTDMANEIEAKVRQAMTTCKDVQVVQEDEEDDE